MNVEVIDVRIGMYLFEESDIILASPQTFVTGRYHMIGVERFNQRSYIRHPLGERLFVFIRESARLIAYLPRHKRGIIHIFYLIIPICSCDDIPDVIGKQSLRAVRLMKLFHVFHISRPTIHCRYHRFAMSRPLQIHGVTATPFPGIIQIEYGRHIAFTQLIHEVIQPG